MQELLGVSKATTKVSLFSERVKAGKHFNLVCPCLVALRQQFMLLGEILLHEIDGNFFVIKPLQVQDQDDEVHSIVSLLIQNEVLEELSTTQIKEFTSKSFQSLNWTNYRSLPSISKNLLQPKHWKNLLWITSYCNSEQLPQSIKNGVYNLKTSYRLLHWVCTTVGGKRRMCVNELLGSSHQKGGFPENVDVLSSLEKPFECTVETTLLSAILFFFFITLPGVS